MLVWCMGILRRNQAAAWVANMMCSGAFRVQYVHAGLALQDEDMEEYDDNEEAEEVDEDDMGDDDEEEDEEEEDEEQDGLPFISPYHVIDEEEEDGEEEDEEEEDNDDEEEEAEGLLEMDDDAFEVEVNRVAGWDQFEHMLGSGSAATRARRMELAGKPAFCCC